MKIYGEYDEHDGHDWHDAHDDHDADDADVVTGELRCEKIDHPRKII